MLTITTKILFLLPKYIDVRYIFCHKSLLSLHTSLIVLHLGNIFDNPIVMICQQYMRMTLQQ